jgi:hypothetical protein
MNKAVASVDTPSPLIDARLSGLADRRGMMLSRLRTLIRQAVPGVPPKRLSGRSFGRGRC